MSKAGPASESDHRKFLNQYYGISRHFYDLTRKYYLFGRDLCLDELAADHSWGSLLEMGPGTGRNLARIRSLRPEARYGGIEASDEMLQHATGRHPWARIEHGFAETADLTKPFGKAPDVILFSYSLSMIQQGDTALDAAQAGVKKGGQVVIVDFGDFRRIPAFGGPMRTWLHTFHVLPVDTAKLEARGGTVTWGPGRYFFVARLPHRTP